MSTNDWRHRADVYPLAGAISPRFADMDRWQHLNNAALIGLHGEVALQALSGVLGPDLWRPGPTSLLLRASQTDFLAESHYPAPLATGARLLGLDPQGLHLATALFQHGQCVGLHRAVWGPSCAGAAGPPSPLHSPPPWPPHWEHALACALASAPALPGVPGDAGALLLPGPPGLAPTLAQMAWQTTLPLRFADTDARGLVADATLARLAEQLRVGLVAQLATTLTTGGNTSGNTGFMVAQVALRWLQRGPAPEAFTAGSRVTRVGERSIGLQGALFDADGACVATADSVLVCIDRASRRSTTLPQALRQALNATQAATHSAS